MGAHPSAQRFLQQLLLLTQPAFGQFGQGNGIGLSLANSASMARPLTPITSVATLANLMLASSSTFCTRLTSLLRSSPSFVR